MPAFVVLLHDHPTPHWDLMLDTGSLLRTWRLDEAPRAGLTTRCESLPDHRRAYLDYEGPVSGGRGSVKRVAAGQYEILEETAALLRVRMVMGGRDLVGELVPPTGCGMASFN